MESITSQIYVFDDIIPQNQANYLEKLYNNEIKGAKQIPWFYTPHLSTGFSDNPPSSDNMPKSETGFSLNFLSGDQKHHRLFAPLYSFLQSQDLALEEVFLARSFLQTPNPYANVQQPHTDIPIPHWVVLYYVLDSDGDTIFYDDNQKEIARVPPKKGRIVCFNGMISHSGSSPLKSTRIVINYTVNFASYNNFNI